ALVRAQCLEVASRQAGRSGARRAGGADGEHRTGCRGGGDEQRGGSESRNSGVPHAYCLAPQAAAWEPPPPVANYLTAPAARLRTSCFWKMSNRITSGTKAMTAPASDTGICETSDPRSCFSPICTVL